MLPGHVTACVLFVSWTSTQAIRRKVTFARSRFESDPMQASPDRRAQGRGGEFSFEYSRLHLSPGAKTSELHHTRECIRTAASLDQLGCNMLAPGAGCEKPTCLWASGKRIWSIYLSACTHCCSSSIPRIPPLAVVPGVSNGARQNIPCEGGGAGRMGCLAGGPLRPGLMAQYFLTGSPQATSSDDSASLQSLWVLP